MNRQQRRAMKANSSQQEYVRFLEQENRRLMEHNQHLEQVKDLYSGVIHDLQANGKAQVVVANDADGVHRAFSVEQASELVRYGIDRTLDEVFILEQASYDVNQAIAGTFTAAFCTNGPDTRIMMQKALNSLMTAVDNFDTVCKRENAMIAYSERMITIIGDFVQAVRPLIKNYLIQGTQQTQDELRRYLTSQNPAIAELKVEIDKLPQRGRERDAVLDLAASMAQAITAKDHVSRGLTMYRQLTEIPASARTWVQLSLMNELASYLTPDGKRVDEEMREKFRKRISGMYTRSVKVASEK